MASLAPSQSPRNDVVRGILFRCAMVVCFATMSAFMKAASASGVNAIEMLFYRSTFGLPVVVGWLLVGPGIGVIRTKRPLAHLGRSALGIVAITANFQALILLPLATASTIGFSAPIFATILSATLLSEKVGWHRWTAVVLGFIGIAVVMRPGGESISHAGMAFALFGACGTAAVTITIRQIGGTENSGTIVFWFFVCASLVSGVATLFVGHLHPWPVMALLLGGAIFGAVMQLLMTMSLGAAPVSAVAPFDYTQIIWALLLDWLIWSGVPTLHVLLGAALIVASGIYTGVREHRLRKMTVAATPPLE